MKKVVLFLFFMQCCFSFLISDSLNDVDFLKKIDKLVSFDKQDLSAEYEIETVEPEGSVSKKNIVMFRRDWKDQFVILIQKPETDKGKGYLRQGDILWLYEPKNGSFTFTSAKDKFQSTALRNSDFGPTNYARDYKIVEQSKEVLGRFNCNVLTLEAISKNVSFPKRKMWVDESFLVRKMEDYSLSGQLLRTIAIPSYQKVKNNWLPVSLIIYDHLIFKRINGKLKYGQTTVKVKEPSLKKLSDDLFTKEYLQRIR